MSSRLHFSAQILTFFLFYICLGKVKAETCTSNTQCDYFIKGSSCTEGKCTCPDELVLSGNGALCLPLSSGYGESCIEDVQCATTLGAGGKCSGSTCSCSIGYHYLQGRCWKSIPLDETCFQDEQCCAGFDFTGLICQAQVCQCRSGYYRRGNVCRRLRGQGEECIVDSDCDCEGGICSSSLLCECSSYITTNKEYTSPRNREHVYVSADGCDPGTFDKDGVCVPELGTTCTAESDDCANGVTYATCVDDRICGCENSTRIRSFNNRACNKVALQFEVSTCAEDGQCVTFGNYSICGTSGIRKICTCAEGAHFVQEDNLCHLSRFVGDSCEEDNDCLVTSDNTVSCSQNVCTCVPGSHVAENNHDCRNDSLLVGDACIEDLDCMFPNAVCDTTSKQCQCSNHYYDESGACTPGVGSVCKEEADCQHISSASCITSDDGTASCQCSAGQVSSVNFRSCLPIVNASEACSQTDQCNSTMGDLKDCKNGTCACLEGAQYILGRCYLIKKLGEKCNARAECVYPGGDPDAYMCQNAVCTCQYGFHRNEDKCE